ncbi:MAG: thioredoxin domain-containing protein, partial [Ignavibacteriae bacterium]|nr:thioredoxin domain-containing protein [Ignavibacteriota bacterium]
EDYDGAEPTGNSVSVLNLLRLAHITSNNDWKLKAEQTLNLFGASLSTHPHVLPQMLVALDWWLSTPKEIILVGEIDSEEIQTLVTEIHSRFLPYKVLLFVDEQSRKSLEKILPFIKEMQQIDNKPTAYICKNFACQLPTSDISVVRELLTK